MNSDLATAIENSKRVKFIYKGEFRIVNPYTYGTDKNGGEQLRGYQVGGESSSQIPDWRIFKLERMSFLDVLDESFSGDDPGYTQGDSGMVEIFCEV